MHSVESAGSIAMVGMFVARLGDSPVELARERVPLATVGKKPARADFCRVRKPGAESEDPGGRGVVGREGEGFMTCRRRGPMDSR